MKLQIDTTAKTIKVDENIKFDKLIKVLNKLLPKEWKSYTLESNCTIIWGTYPWVTYNPIVYTPQPLIPTWEVTCADTGSGSSITTTAYNIEVLN